MLGEATASERAEIWMHTGGTEQLAAAWPAQVQPAAPAVPPPVAAPQADRTQNGHAHVFEVEHQGERLGSLRVTPSPREPLTPAGERLVQAVAGQAAWCCATPG